VAIPSISSLFVALKTETVETAVPPRVLFEMKFFQRKPLHLFHFNSHAREWSVQFEQQARRTSQSLRESDSESVVADLPRVVGRTVESFSTFLNIGSLMY